MNLRSDADTTAAICGQVAGAHYVRAGIPSGWLDKLFWQYEMVALEYKLVSYRQHK